MPADDNNTVQNLEINDGATDGGQGATDAPADGGTDQPEGESQPEPTAPKRQGRKPKTPKPEAPVKVELSEEQVIGGYRSEAAKRAAAVPAAAGGTADGDVAKVDFADAPEGAAPSGGTLEMFKAKAGTVRAKLLTALDDARNTFVPEKALQEAMYGQSGKEQKGPLMMSLKGAQKSIEDGNLPVVIGKFRKNGETHFGLFFPTEE